MLLMQTTLNLTEKATVSSLYNAIYRWNSRSPLDEDRVRGLTSSVAWDRTIGSKDCNIQFLNADNKRRFGCRYRKIDADGTKWTTDITADFNSKRIMISLSRTQPRGHADMWDNFNPPYIIKMLCEEGFIGDDLGFRVMGEEKYDTDCMQPLANAINGREVPELPIVYISSGTNEMIPIDAHKLAAGLTGSAHVVVQETDETQLTLKSLTSETATPFFGYVAVYIPGEEAGMRKYKNQTGDHAGGVRLINNIKNAVFRYNNSIDVPEQMTFTGMATQAILEDTAMKKRQYEKGLMITERWDNTIKLKDEEIEKLKANEKALMEKCKGISEEDVAAIRDKAKEEAETLIRKREEEILRQCEEEKAELQKEHDDEIRKKNDALTEALKLLMGPDDDTAIVNEATEAKQEAEDLIAAFDEDVKKKDELIAQLMKENEKLKAVGNAMASASEGKTDIPLLFLGDEKDKYPGEIRDIVIRAIERGIEESAVGTRRNDVLVDISEANGGYKGLAEEKAEAIKKILKSVKSIGTQQITAFEKEGFTVEKDRRHYKVFLAGDKRYSCTLSATPSDTRSYSNAAGEIINSAL